MRGWNKECSIFPSVRLTKHFCARDKRRSAKKRPPDKMLGEISVLLKPSMLQTRPDTSQPQKPTTDFS